MNTKSPFLAAIATTLIVPLGLAGCASGASDDDVASRLESAITRSVPHANGAFASLAYSGASHRTVRVNVYLDTDDLTAIGAAVDTAFDVVWSSTPVKPVRVSVGAVIGNKPDNAKPFDADGMDMLPVAAELGIDERKVLDRLIILDDVAMDSRYGVWTEPATQ